MATAFLNPTLLPTRDTSDVKVDGDRRTTEALTGNTPALTVTLGATPQTVDSVWFGVSNVAKATIALDGTVIVAADEYAKKYPGNYGFASFTSQDVTDITLSVTEKTDSNLDVLVSEVVAGTLLLSLPDGVFRPDLNPDHVRRRSGVHELLGGGLRPYSTVNNGNTKLDITHTGSFWDIERAEAFEELYNSNQSFYFIRDTVAHPLDGYMAVFGNDRLATPFSSNWKFGGQNVSFSVREC